MTTESDRLNRIADQNRRTDELREEVARLHSELTSARTVERKDLHEQIERLRGALTACEWADNSGEEYTPACPVCGASKGWPDPDPHKSGCIVAAALAQPAATGEGG